MAGRSASSYALSRSRRTAPQPPPPHRRRVPELLAADNDEQLNLALNDHVKAVKTHILDLQSKDYTNLIGVRSPSFVLMFMPIEPAYIEALKYEKDLFAFGYERGVVLVSHTTLIPILRTVANLWAMERSTREARELAIARAISTTRCAR